MSTLDIPPPVSGPMAETKIAIGSVLGAGGTELSIRPATEVLEALLYTSPGPTANASSPRMKVFMSHPARKKKSTDRFAGWCPRLPASRRACRAWTAWTAWTPSSTARINRCRSPVGQRFGLNLLAGRDRSFARLQGKKLGLGFRENRLCLLTPPPCPPPP